MALLIIAPGEEEHARAWRAALQAVAPELDVRLWPKAGELEEVDAALTWAHPPGELRRYPNLRLVASMGAGVDHLLRDPELPEGVAIVRLVDESLVQSMTEYVVLAVLHRYRRFDVYRTLQAQRRWVPQPRPSPRDVRVGVMGLGQLGDAAARALHQLGLPVRGWARRRKASPGAECFAGQAELGAFLAQTNVLVCLLPLTPETENILNRATFDRLPRGAYLVNVARGGHLVEADLLDALERGQLSGACLDVFRTEPLPGDHPFWTHPRIIVTPHISSLTDPEACAPQVVENLRRVLAGEPLRNVVDREHGY